MSESDCECACVCTSAVHQLFTRSARAIRHPMLWMVSEPCDVCIKITNTIIRASELHPTQSCSSILHMNHKWRQVFRTYAVLITPASVLMDSIRPFPSVHLGIFVKRPVKGPESVCKDAFSWGGHRTTVCGCGCRVCEVGSAAIKRTLSWPKEECVCVCVCV